MSEHYEMTYRLPYRVFNRGDQIYLRVPRRDEFGNETGIQHSIDRETALRLMKELLNALWLSETNVSGEPCHE